METEATEKEALKMDEKTPETPVTEPMTNGSSAPESPKEEVRQNGESAPVDEPAVVAEPAPPAPEAAKPAEVQPPAPEVPSVESLPINGLKIDDSPAEEVKVESKVDAPPAPAEVTPAPEVCVAKEKPEVAESAEVAPPPLPANPPPSSLTIFAETTMAPHLVDKPVAGELPVVDVDASLSSIPPPIPVNTATDDAQQANSETTVCEIKPVDNVPSASSNDIVQNQSPPTSDEKIFETPIIANNTINTPLESVPLVNETNEIVDSCVKSEIVENLAVVSTTNVPDIPAPSSETEPISPVSQITENKTALLEESVVDNKPIQETVDVVPVAESAPVSEPIEQTATENNHVQEIIEKDTITPIESNPNVEVNPANANEIESIVSNIVESEPVSLGNIPVSTEIKNELETNVTTLPLEEVQSIISLESESNVNVLPPVINESIPPLNAPDSPLLQRTPSDPDMSESDLKEPQSDSFPPPPPPASCPESITEISVSESLPPPPSESSQPDTVLNSPTSEIADFPPKDLPSPVKNDQNTEQKDSVETEALPVVEPQVVQTTLHENSIAPTTETATTNGINGLPESPVELSNGEESQQPPPADTSLQVNSTQMESIFVLFCLCLPNRYIINIDLLRGILITL